MNPLANGPSALFTLVPLFIGGVFLVVVISVFVRLGKGVAEWSSNNAQPDESGPARVAGKRMQVAGTDSQTSTEYFVTFELTSGERREFSVRGRDYGLLSEGDAGLLRHQGTWYLGFARDLSAPDAQDETTAAAGSNLVCAYCGAGNPPGATKCAGCGSGKLAPAAPTGETS